MTDEVDGSTKEMAVAAALAMTAAKRAARGEDAKCGSFEYEVMVNARHAMRMFQENSLPMLLLRSVRLVAVVNQVEFEESSRRFIIHFQCEGEEPEMIRTLRTDKHYGEDIRRMVSGVVGKRCLIYKTNIPMSGQDGEKGRTVRVTPYVVALS